MKGRSEERESSSEKKTNVPQRHRGTEVGTREKAEDRDEGKRRSLRRIAPLLGVGGGHAGRTTPGKISNTKVRIHEEDAERILAQMT